MIIPKFTFPKSLLFIFIFTFSVFTTFAQVGIGNTNPDPSAMLDITSESQGILTPRMTTAQRLAISNPANGLMVYDLNESAFYFYEATKTEWVSLNSSLEKRSNFVLVKSEADFPAPVGGVITLHTNTFYEINGTIVLNNTIDLNNAYVSGLDANEDRLIMATGTMFSGSKGGSIKNLTLLGGFAAGSGSGTAFNIIGTTDQNLLIQNTIIANMANVGTISGLGLFFTNIVQFSGNSTGITYSNIGRLLLSNQAWFGNNNGTFEKLTGSFTLVQKVSGFSEVNVTSVGIDVSSNPTVAEGVLLTTAFTGGGTYVDKYTTGSYSGYNFTNAWTVDCAGIPRETDDVASGNFYYNGDLTTGFIQTITSGTAVEVQGNGTFTSSHLFRFSAIGDNRLRYDGSITRNFQINASIAIRGEVTNEYYAFIIAKNDVVETESNSIARISRSYTAPDGGNPAYYSYTIQNVPINAVVTLAPGDYIELYVQRLTGSGSSNIVVFSENLSIK